MKGVCKICENSCDYDKETIKGDTYRVNGIKVIICGNCVEDLVKTLKKRGEYGK